MSTALRSPPPQRWASLLSTLIDGNTTQGSAATLEQTGREVSDIDDLLARSAAAVERQLTVAQSMRARFAAARARAAGSVQHAIPAPAEPTADSGMAPHVEPVGGLDIKW
jgi:hypothetical protein